MPFFEGAQGCNVSGGTFTDVQGSMHVNNYTTNNVTTDSNNTYTTKYSNSFNDRSVTTAGRDIHSWGSSTPSLGHPGTGYEPPPNPFGADGQSVPGGFPFDNPEPPKKPRKQRRSQQQWNPPPEQYSSYSDPYNTQYYYDPHPYQQDHHYDQGGQWQAPQEQWTSQPDISSHTPEYGDHRTYWQSVAPQGPPNHHRAEARPKPRPVSYTPPANQYGNTAVHSFNTTMNSYDNVQNNNSSNNLAVNANPHNPFRQTASSKNSQQSESRSSPRNPFLQTLSSAANDRLHHASSAENRRPSSARAPSPNDLRGAAAQPAKASPSASNDAFRNQSEPPRRQLKPAQPAPPAAQRIEIQCQKDYYAYEGLVAASDESPISPPARSDPQKRNRSPHSTPPARHDSIESWGGLSYESQETAVTTPNEPRSRSPFAAPSSRPSSRSSNLSPPTPTLSQPSRVNNGRQSPTEKAPTAVLDQQSALGAAQPLQSALPPSGHLPQPEALIAPKPTSQLAPTIVVPPADLPPQRTPAPPLEPAPPQAIPSPDESPEITFTIVSANGTTQGLASHSTSSSKSDLMNILADLGEDRSNPNYPDSGLFDKPAPTASWTQYVPSLTPDGGTADGKKPKKSNVLKKLFPSHRKNKSDSGVEMGMGILDS